MVEMMEGIDTYNWRTKCWGESNVDSYILQSEAAKRECMQMEPTIDTPEFGLPTNPFSPLTNNPFRKLQSGGDINELTSLWRSKRAVEGILKPDNEDLYDFLQDVAEHREMKRNKMGNLTCVLMKMKMLTEDMEVNMEFYTTGLTGETDPELGLSFDDEESEAVDPEWRQKMSDSYQDCWELSQNFPQSALGRQPFHRVFGRRMIFFRCAAKVEKQVCAEGLMFKQLEKFYGTLEPEALAERLSTLELPEDKYDAAIATVSPRGTRRQRRRSLWTGSCGARTMLCTCRTSCSQQTISCVFTVSAGSFFQPKSINPEP